MAVASSYIRRFAKGLMGYYVNLGYSSRAIQRDLINRFGRAYRFQNIQADIRAFTGRAKLQERIEKLDPKQTAPKSVMIDTDLKQPHKYRVHGQMSVYNVDTGETSLRRISFYDDFNEGTESWAERFIQQFKDSRYETGQIITGVDIVQIDHQKGFPF